MLIKIPATKPGLPAITASIAEGISVNVTLIFSLDRYRGVIDAYLDGLEQAAANGHDLSQIHSVASFFVSRVDTEVDKRLDAIGTDEAKALKGKAAIANARLAYALYEEVFAGDRCAALEAQGRQQAASAVGLDRRQGPVLPDTLYVTELVVAEHREHHAGEDHAGVRRPRRGRRATRSAAPRRRGPARCWTTWRRSASPTTTWSTVLEREGVEKFDASWA